MHFETLSSEAAKGVERNNKRNLLLNLKLCNPFSLARIKKRSYELLARAENKEQRAASFEQRTNA